MKNKPNAGLLTAAAVVNSGATASVFFGMFSGERLKDLLILERLQGVSY